MKQQVSRRSGIPHQMVAIGFAQGEESTEPPIPPVKNEPPIEPKTAASLDRRQCLFSRCLLASGNGCRSGWRTGELNPDHLEQSFGLIGHPRRHDVRFPYTAMPIVRKVAVEPCKKFTPCEASTIKASLPSS